MTRIHWYLSSSRFALAALFAAGVAASPIAVAAQDAGAGADGNGAAQEFVDPNDPTSDVGGNLEPGMSSGEKYVVDPESAEFDRYRQAAERGDADAAGSALREAAGDREVTPDMVMVVNDDLDVITVLTPEQIADAANESEINN